MDKSDTSQFKSLCYNCLFKLQLDDIEKKVCPSCDMPINKDGLPLKNSSNSNWKKVLKPNQSEVEQIFFPPINYLLSPKYHLREKPPINSSMSMTWTINYNNKNIWGLTARVLVTISAGLGLREFPPCDDI